MARHVTAPMSDLASVPALLCWLRSQGFELIAKGDRLRIRPADRVTPELRDAIARHKAELLKALAPIEYVTLRGGLILPLPVLQLAWNLEDRGFRMVLDGNQQITVEPQAGLTDADRSAIERWRLHLAAIVAYQSPAVI